MKIGSHNTMTYLPVKQWWLKPFVFMAKCQCVDWKTQYEKYNVRWFDLRLYWDELFRIEYRHNFFRYSADNLDDFLSYLNDKGDVYVRVLFEERQISYHNPDRLDVIDLFKEKCEQIESTYPNIKFTNGQSTHTGEQFYKFKTNPPTEYSFYSSVTSPWEGGTSSGWGKIDDWFPWIYAMLNTKKKYEEYKDKEDKEFLIVDYVNKIG